MFYNIAKSIAWFILKLVFKIEISGLENVPEDGGFILASNHRSLPDPVFIAARLKHRVYFMAKSELFWWPFSVIIRALGAFPVKRGQGDHSAVDKANNIIKSQKVLGIFPEGTRSKSGEPLRPKSGIAIIAKDTKADILPVGIHFDGKLRFRSKITVTYGKLIKFEELELGEDMQTSAIKKASRLVMDRIIELSKPKGTDLI